jgi:RimJ/RimL family protein N-acetyltransferase
LLHGDLVTLRPVTPADLSLLYEWRMDAETWQLSEDDPLVPMTFARYEERHKLRESDEVGAEFAIEGNGELVGRCGMFAFDHLARHASIGITIGLPHRGPRLRARRRTRARRLRLPDPQPAPRPPRHRLDQRRRPAAYLAAGFVEEGRLREHAWVDGRYVDLVQMGVLRSEWNAER